MRFKFLQVHFSANTWFRTFTPGLTKVRQLLIPLSGEVYKLYINPILNSWRAYSELIPHKTLTKLFLIPGLQILSGFNIKILVSIVWSLDTAF